MERPAEHENDENRRAKSYKRARLTFFVAGILFSWTTGAIFLLSGKSRELAKSTSRISRNDRVNESAAILSITMLSWIISLPLAYLRGYRLEHQYEMSNQTRVTWFADQLKGLALQLTLLVPVSQVMLWVIRKRPRDWWAVLSAMAIPFTVVLAHLAPVLIAPIFNTYQPLRDRELAERLKALSARSGIQVADIMEVDMSRQTKAANAFFTGIGSTKRIVLSDTLIENMSHDEIETIVAHEIGHQAHRDLWRLLALGTVTTAAIAWTTQRLFSFVHQRTANSTGIRGAGYAEALPMIELVASVAGMAIMPVQNAFSRYIERQADTYALELTNKPDAFASGLDRLRVISLADPDPGRLEQILLHSHPTLHERIEACERYARDRQSA